MITQILACCKYCGAQSMWYDVVNSIPCLVKFMTNWAGIILLFFIFAKYGAECLKFFWPQGINSSKGTKKTAPIGDNQNQESENVTEREKNLSDELTMLKEVSRQKEGLWRSYKELLEENYKEQVKKTVDEKTKSSDIE